MKILHFAIENYARVPANLVKAERELGHESYLMTLYRTFQRFDDEDYCLNLPFVGTPPIRYLRSLLSSKTTNVTNTRRDVAQGVPTWRPTSRFVWKLFAWRDQIWEQRVRKALKSIDIESFDVISLDGGAGFLRSGKIVKELKDKGIKIVICYCGSDLRTRGIIPAIEEIADYRFTFEFDHTLLYPELKFLYFPFVLTPFDPPKVTRAKSIRIGHAPTSRAAKGTAGILKSLDQLATTYPIEVVLIENLPHKQALSLKAGCDIFVDTIGELGYGVNSLEALAMGIPTAVEILGDFEEVLGDHPFINISWNTIVDKLKPLIESEDLRRKYAEKGRAWVQLRHDPLRVSNEMLGYLLN
ncbi:hypothetical protein MJD09_15720 [bacterium]|nr:hypothetical protein [bacterium]